MSDDGEIKVWIDEAAQIGDTVIGAPTRIFGIARARLEQQSVGAPRLLDRADASAQSSPPDPDRASRSVKLSSRWSIPLDQWAAGPGEAAAPPAAPTATTPAPIVSPRGRSDTPARTAELDAIDAAVRAGAVTRCPPAYVGPVRGARPLELPRREDRRTNKQKQVALHTAMAAEARMRRRLRALRLR